ncbi:MAG: glycosyltransferase family 2 protein [Tannerella sp.]|jgi:glycosyltransferase involved in cell wall biosynthesis|nr:glycosyltransferase family 2 protein [Tannerella sp.]
MMEGKISVVIHTYNSEKYLNRVLSSVKDFDEILICDMYSTDHTLEIAQKYNCNIVFHEKCEVPEPARDFAIHSASNEWVLVVDSDEIVPEALKSYLYERIKEQSDLQGLWLTRKNFILGHFLHGDYPDYILRFFRKDNACWPPYVHTLPEVKGRVEYLPKRKKELALIHLVNNSMSNKLRKIDTYTNNEVLKRAGQDFSILKMFTATFFRFFKSYIIKGGFRDGKAGAVIAGIDAFYKFVTIAKIWESKIRKEDLDKDLQP